MRTYECIITSFTMEVSENGDTVVEDFTPIGCQFHTVTASRADSAAADIALPEVRECVRTQGVDFVLDAYARFEVKVEVYREGKLCGVYCCWYSVGGVQQARRPFKL